MTDTRTPRGYLTDRDDRLTLLERRILPARLGAFGQPIVEDVNEAVTDGWYTISSSGVLNLPVSTAVGELFVETNANGDIRQTFHRIYASGVADASGDFREWYRIRYQDAWTPWFLDDPRNIADSALPARLRAQGASITDWNAATEVGFYYGTNAANQPATGDAYWVGEVQYHPAGGGYVLQTLRRPNRGDNFTYQRRLYQGAWSAWETDAPAFAWQAQNASAQSIPINTWTPVVLEGVRWGASGITYNPADQTFTVERSGVYTISGQVGFSANATGRRLARIATPSGQGFVQTEVVPVNGQATSVGVNIVAPLTAGTALQLQAYQNAASTLALRNALMETFLSVARVSGYV